MIQYYCKKLKKNNIGIDDNEKNQIENMSKQSINETDEEIAKKIGLTTEEYLQFSIEKQIETRVIEKMREKIISNILDGNININDADFEQKMQKFQQSKDLQEKNEMLKDVYNSYLTYLINNSEIFYSK